MNPPSADLLGRLQRVADQAATRLWRASWMKLLETTALPAAVIGAMLLVAVQLYLGEDAPVWLGVTAAGVLLVGWIAVTGIISWQRRPGRAAALASWDSRQARNELFVSAYDFLSSPSTRDAGPISLHIEEATRRLPAEQARLAEALPVGFSRRAPWVILALIALGLVRFSTPQLIFGTEAVTQDQRDAAAKAAEKIAARADQLPPPNALTPEEKKKLEELKESLAALKNSVKNQDNAKDMLGEMERRAKQAEELAKSLAGEDANTLSKELLDEMQKHADTSQLANAFRNRDLKAASAEAAKMAEQLKDKDLKIETKQRIGDSLSKSSKAEKPSDEKKPAGQTLKGADKDMQNDQPKKAAEKFEELSKNLNREQQRDLAKKQMEQLARELREAGQGAVGQNRSEGQQQQSPTGNDSPGSSANQPRPLDAKSLSMAPPSGNPSGQNRQIPGGAPPPGGNKDQQQGQGNKPPIPGTGKSPQGGGDPKGNGGQAPPIPGTAMAPVAPGQGGQPGAGPGGMVPVPGTVPGGTANGVGGTKAGNGTAGYDTTSTKALQATGTGTVAPTAINDEGQSQTREVEGAPRTEKAQRSAQAVARDTVQAEEEALLAEPLPPSRRDQVLQYFKSLRSKIDQ